MGWLEIRDRQFVSLSAQTNYPYRIGFGRILKPGCTESFVDKRIPIACLWFTVETKHGEVCSWFMLLAFYSKL